MISDLHGYSGEDGVTANGFLSHSLFHECDGLRIATESARLLRLSESVLESLSSRHRYLEHLWRRIHNNQGDELRADLLERLERLEKEFSRIRSLPSPFKHSTPDNLWKAPNPGDGLESPFKHGKVRGARDLQVTECEREEDDEPWDDNEPDFDQGKTYHRTSLRKKVYRRADDTLDAPLVLGDRVAQYRMLLAAGASVRSLAQQYGIPEAQIRAEVSHSGG